MRFRRVSRLFASVALLAALSGFGTSSVSAHAAYKSSVPAADSALQAAPSTILITFAEEVKTINVTVKGPGGGNITNGPAILNLADRTNVSVPIHPGGNGRYEVDWNNVSSDDGDPDSGTFFFTVGTGAAAPAPAPAAPAVAPAAAAPAPAPAAAPAGRAADVASDGRTLAGEPQATQSLFRAVWGDRAAVEWATEHTAALAGGR